jgi:hypothetical protein
VQEALLKALRGFAAYESATTSRSGSTTPNCPVSGIGHRRLDGQLPTGNLSRVPRSWKSL